MKFRVKSTLKYSVQRMTPTKAVRIALLVISDALILNIASFLALWVWFEFHFEQLVRETDNRCAFFIQIYAPIQAGKQQLQADDDNRRGAGSDGCPAGVPRKHTFRKQSRLPYRR